MKLKSKELDVDFIGGQDPLTKLEEQAISEYIKASKLKNSKKNIKLKNSKSKKDSQLV